MTTFTLPGVDESTSFDYLRNYRLHQQGNELVRQGDARALIDRVWLNPLPKGAEPHSHTIFVAPWVWSRGRQDETRLPLLWIPLDRDGEGKSIIHRQHPIIPGAAFSFLDYRFPDAGTRIDRLRGNPILEKMDDIVRILLEDCELKPDTPPPGYTLAGAALYASRKVKRDNRREKSRSRLPIPSDGEDWILAAKTFSGLNAHQSDLITSIRNLRHGEHQVADGPAASGKSYTISALLENEASIASIIDDPPQSICLIAGDFRPPRPGAIEEAADRNEISDRWIDVAHPNYLFFSSDSFTSTGMPSSTAYASLLSDLRSENFLREERRRWYDNFNLRFPGSNTIDEGISTLQSLLHDVLTETKIACDAVSQCLDNRKLLNLDDLQDRRKKHLMDLKAVSDELAALQSTAPKTETTVPDAHSGLRPTPIRTFSRVLSLWRKQPETTDLVSTNLIGPDNATTKRKLTLRDKKRHHINQLKKIDRSLRAEGVAVSLVENIWSQRPDYETDRLLWAAGKLQHDIPRLNYHLSMRLREGRFIQAMSNTSIRPPRVHSSPFDTDSKWLSLLGLLFDGIAINRTDLNAAISALSAHDGLAEINGKFERLIIEPDVTVTATLADAAPILANSTVFLVDRSISDENSDNPHLRYLETTTKFCQNLPLAPPGITLPVSYGWSTAAAVRANNVALSRLMMPAAQHAENSFLFHAPIHGQATCDNGLIRNSTEATAIYRWLNDHEPQISDFLGGLTLEEAVIIATPFHGQREAIWKLTRERFPKLKVVSQDTISFSDAKLAIFSPCVSALDRSPAGVTMKTALKSFFGNAKFSSAIFGDSQMFQTLKNEGVPLEEPETLPFHTPIYPGVVISRELQTLQEHENALQEVLLRAERRVLIGSLNWHLPFSTWKRKDVSLWINQALERGVAITLIIGLKGASEDYVRQSINSLIRHPINLIIHNKGHSKVVLADDNAKITGSFNWFGGGEFVDTSIYTRTKATDNQIQELWDSTIIRYSTRTVNQPIKASGLYSLPRLNSTRRPPPRSMPQRK